MSLLASRRLITEASHPVGMKTLVRWRSKASVVDGRTVPLRKLPRIELNPGERMPIENKQKLHIRVYETLIVNTDGSAYYAESPMPYPITFIPLDLSKLSEEELERRRMAHLPTKKNDEELDQGFSDEEMKIKEDYKRLL